MGKEQDLVQSIRTNDVELFRKIIAKFKSKTKKGNKKSSLHIVDHDGFIPLHHAALSGNGEIVMGLLEFSTDVNSKDKKGMTPLHLAAWAGKVEPALLLLDAGAETNLCSRSGATPLHLASEHGNYGVVERLVDHDCDPTVVNNHGETALDLACRFGHLEVVRILLNNSRGKCEKLLNPKEFQEKSSPLHMAAKTGHVDVVKLLVEAGADINQKGPTGTCLHEAALYGKTDVVKYLVEAGVDVNVKNRDGQTALDIVTQFTKTGASSEIKQLLRESSVEVVYAKAIKDYANITDDTFLTLRMGDIVLVFDRRKDGMWKGCVRDDQKERVGFFPSSVVKVLRSPSRHSVKRSSSSSSEASKVSTVGTVSNTVEIVTVAPPSQPVASKPHAPRMSSFRKKAPNKSISVPDDRSHQRTTNGEARRSNIDRTRSESDAHEKKKKLNYLDIVVVENRNNKSEHPSVPAVKTEYADVFVSNASDSKDNEKADTNNKNVVRANETQKSVRVGGSYARLGQQMFGKQGSEDNEKLRQELQRQQEERVKRQQMRMEQENRKRQDEAEKQRQIEVGLREQQQKQQLHERAQQQQLKILQQQQQQHEKAQQLQLKQQLHQQQQQHYDIHTQEPNPSSETHLSQQQQFNTPPPKNPRHYTMSSLVSHSQDLPPLPLKKRHSLSGGRPSAVSDPVLPPKLDKKNRSSLRGDRRTTSPPPPPPPPPSGSSTPSPASSEVSPQSTPRSPSPTLPPLPKAMEVSPLSPSLMKSSELPSSTFSKRPVPAPSQALPPRPQISSLPPPDQPVRSPSPSFPPPPPSISDSTNNTTPPSTDIRNQRSPSPPLPPPPPSLACPSSTSLGDFPPPPQMLIENSPSEDHTLPPPPQMENSTDHADNNPHPKYDTQELIRDHPFPRTNTLEESETTTHATLYPPSSSQSRDGYEDMTRLKRTWTKPEAAVDQKGYVLINPVKRPSSPASSPVNPPTSLKPLSISSMTYENFIPLKTRHFEVRRLPQSVPDEGAKSAGEPSPPKSGESKPVKPGRHSYENFEISGQHGNESKEIQQDMRDDSSEKSTSTALPVLRVPPVPQVPPDPSSGVSNLRMREYDELYDWLAQSKLLAYIDNFAAAGFDLSAMADVTGEDLSEILITKTGHRKRLLSEAAKLSKPVFTYENNVPSWLKSIGLSRYENHFIEGGFDDLEFLSDLTKEDLEAIGITQIGHQRKLLMAAKKLQQRGTAVWKPVV